MSSNPALEEATPLLPAAETGSKRRRNLFLHVILGVVAVAAIASIATVAGLSIARAHLKGKDHYKNFSSVTRNPEPKSFCKWDGKHESGYIGIEVDKNDKRAPKGEDAFKRTFYWFFESEKDAKNAPVILTMGGGPGTSGMVQAVNGMGPCMVQPSGPMILNPDRFTQDYNLIVLDHPVGTGYSYGNVLTETSREAAYDVYDFMQKFYRLHPELVKNQLILVGGSYGGIYDPHIATVFNEQNHLIKQKKGMPGAKHINLESLMISNPISSILLHARWGTYWFCVETDIYNATQCTDAYAMLPACEDAAEIAIAYPTLANKLDAQQKCMSMFEMDLHGRTREDTRKVCHGGITECLPVFQSLIDFFNGTETKKSFGIDPDLSFEFVSMKTLYAFVATADIAQDVSGMFPPLLESGIRVLHYQGIEDGNCNKYGVEAGLRSWKTPFQFQFNTAPDIPWEQASVPTTVRYVGHGAGVMAYVQISDAGHFVVHDQTKTVKKMADYWIANKPWF